jgi:hypothetical protein
MKKFTQINEAKEYSKRSIFEDKRVIDITNIPDEKIKEMMYEKGSGRSNRSYYTYYVCGELKHISKAKDPSSVIRYPNHNQDYVYERGDDPIGDYLMDNGAKLGEEIIILVNW